MATAPAVDFVVPPPPAALIQNIKKCEWVRPPHYPKQLEAIFNPKDVNGRPARYSIIEASTKAGKTRGCIAWLAEQAAINGGPGRNFWWVAPVYPQARIAYRRMKRALSPGIVVRTSDSDLEIGLINGSIIQFKTGEKPDNLYGEDVWAAVIDEASRVREDSWHAVRSTLTATGGPLRCIGNVKGRKNWFYALARRAEHGAPDMSYHKMTAFDAVAGGVFKEAEIEDARAQLPEHVFRELYLAEPADDGGNPFGLAHIRGCIAPLSDEMPFAMGVDLAKSQDWSVVHALDRFGATCGFDRWQSPWNLTVPRVLSLIGDVPTLVDETGVGSPIVEQLQQRSPRVEGIVFTPARKQELMVGLAAAIQKREVTFPPGVIVDELECFEYEYTRTGVRYTAPEGFHDDTVIALALAVEQRRRLSPSLIGVSPGGPVAASPWLGSDTQSL
jgi:hypothetical protein